MQERKWGRGADLKKEQWNSTCFLLNMKKKKKKELKKSYTPSKRNNTYLSWNKTMTSLCRKWTGNSSERGERPFRKVCPSLTMKFLWLKKTAEKNFPLSITAQNRLHKLYHVKVKTIRKNQLSCTLFPS